MRIGFAAFVIGLLLPIAGLAADDGELWEVTSQMNMPGMPAGMGGQKSSVCRAKSESPGPGRNDCKVTDVKRSGLTESMTVNCPDGTMTVEMTYNAARTEYKGTMRMTGKRGDMTINTSGRKVGNCDVAKSKAEREEKVAQAKAQGAAQTAAMNQQLAAQNAKTTASMTGACNAAATSMDASKFPDCLRPSSPLAKSASCTDPRLMEYSFPAAARASCEAKKADYCRNLQTEAGFSVAVAADRRSHVDGTEVCGLQRVTLQAKLCQGAVQRESLDFLSNQCPNEAKQAGARLCPKALQTEAYSYVARFCKSDAQALFKKNCAGRSYTALPDKKMASMCTRLASVDEGEVDGPAPAPVQKAAEAKKATTGQQMEQSVGKGLDKLRGLFGR